MEDEIRAACEELGFRPPSHEMEALGDPVLLWIWRPDGEGEFSCSLHLPSIPPGGVRNALLDLEARVQTDGFSLRVA